MLDEKEGKVGKNTKDRERKEEHERKINPSLKGKDEIGKNI